MSIDIISDVNNRKIFLKEGIFAMYTNQTRITGLSGFDTDSMVKQLMKAESIKYDRLYQKRQLMEWKNLAYQATSTSLLNFQNNFLSFTTNTKNNIRSIANFKGLVPTVKISGGAESTAITVKTTSTTAAGDYKLTVNSVAKADIYKSQAKIASSLTGANDINYSDIREGDSIKLSLDGATSKEIVFDSSYFFTDASGSKYIDESTFAQKLDAKLKQLFGSDAGDKQKITANVVGDKLVINAGEGHIASISAGNRVGVFKMTADVAYEPHATDIEDVAFDVTIGGTTKTVNVGTIKAGATAKEVVNQMNTAIAKAFENSGVSGVSVSLDGDKFVINNSNGDLKASVSDTSGFLNLFFDPATLSQTLDNTSSLTALGVKSGQNTSLDLNQDIFKLFPDAVDTATGKISFKINDKTFTYDAYDPADPDSKPTTLKQLMTDINTADIGVKISFNSTRSEFTMESTNLGQTNGIKLDADFANGFLGKAFGFVDDKNLGDAAKSHISIASDASVTLNGLTTTRETNNFNLEGLSISLTASAAGQTFDINLRKDTTETMSLIKNFVADYNKLIESINKQLNTPRPKSGNYTYYEPLTKEEKKAMSDKEIADWEKEAMTGMLYRDETLSSLQSQLRSMLYQSVEMEDGTKLSLFQLGITTSSKLSEAGYLQIDEEKLQKALDEMPDKVGQFFTKQSDFSASDKKNRTGRLATEGFAERINDIINWTAASGGTLYAKAGQEGLKVDTEMSKKIKEQDEKISDMLAYLARRETYYYNMFSKLEVAMNEANSQMASLQSMLGL